jgi:hypothetical protein
MNAICLDGYCFLDRSAFRSIQDQANELSRAGSFVNLAGVSPMARITRRQCTTIASEAAVSELMLRWDAGR